LMWWNDGLLTKARAACLRSPAELRDRAKQAAERRILPTCIGIVWKVRDIYWTAADWSTAGMDTRGIWIVVGLSFDSGLRIGNLTLKSGRDGEDHCLRTNQFIFSISHNGVDSRVDGGDLTRWLEGRQTAVVLCCDINVSSTKTSRRSSVSATPTFKNMARRTHYESCFLDDLVLWIGRSRTRGDDEISTRYSVTGGQSMGTRQVVGRKEVAEAVKHVHRLEGLPPDLFSCKSLRGGLSTYADAAGLPAADRNSRAGWAPSSSVPESNYSVRMNNVGAFGFTSDSGGITHGVGEIRRMLPPTMSLGRVRLPEALAGSGVDRR